jgi:hypothetical protein
MTAADSIPAPAESCQTNNLGSMVTIGDTKVIEAKVHSDHWRANLLALPVAEEDNSEDSTSFFSTPRMSGTASHRGQRGRQPGVPGRRPLAKVQPSSPACRGFVTTHGFRLGYGGRRFGSGSMDAWLLRDSPAFAILEAYTGQPVVFICLRTPGGVTTPSRCFTRLAR